MQEQIKDIIITTGCNRPRARVSRRDRNQNYWENSKWYYFNVERGNAADKLNGRNINVFFINNSNVPIEVMIFIFYSDEIVIDVKTGLVTRRKT
jgi:hypothetical protein